MKRLLIIFLIVFAFVANSYGQTDGKWSAGVGVTPIFDGLTSSIYLNRHFGDKWAVGAMPFTRFYKFSSANTKTNSIMLGLNINSRFYPLERRLFQPYIYAYGGYGETSSTFVHYNDGSTSKSLIKFLNTSVGIGLQVAIGKSGWSLDGNFGYQGYFATSEKYNFNTYVYSFGFFKRFGKSAK